MIVIISFESSPPEITLKYVAMISYLVYSSKAIEPISQSDLDDIAISSKKNNKTLDITGILLGVEGYFLQYLEGPENNVRDLYKIICEDNRHQEIELRATGKIDRRIFREWSLGSWLMPKRKFIELSGLYDIKRFLKSGKNYPLEAYVYIDLFNDILRSWIDEEKERGEPQISNRQIIL